MTEPAPAAPRAAAIELDGLRKSYGGVLALDVPRLAIGARMRLALIGPSGCGKSTLLRLLTGLIAPDQGRIVIGGVALGPATVQAIRLRLGYVIQEGGLFPHLTAGENVAIVARELGWSAARVRERTEALLLLTRLDAGLLGRYPAELSGGQRQRVALMRALFLEPEVVLMDEPLAALDPMIRAELQRELKELFARLETTVVLVTHELAEAAYLGDEIALMRGGHIVQVGPFAALRDRPAEPFVTEFLRAQRTLVEAAGA